MDTTSRDLDLHIDSASWRRIEKACGLSFSPSLRSDIVQATDSFLFLKHFARTHEPLAKVKVILEAHDKAATRFFNELFAGPSAVSDAGIYAHHLIEENLKFTQAGKDALGLDAMLNLLRAFHIACNASLKQLNDASSAAALQQVDEDAWVNWIRRLSKTFEGLQSPGAGGKDRGSENPSSFVSFVWELQKCLPAECRLDQAALEKTLPEARPKNQKPTSMSAF
jgi:hypothetical protein